jgi:hypothetical protein
MSPNKAVVILRERERLKDLDNSPTFTAASGF